MCRQSNSYSGALLGFFWSASRGQGKAFHIGEKRNRGRWSTTRKNNTLDAMKLLGETGIPAGAVLDTDELNKDVTFEQRGIMQTMVHPVHRPFKMPGWPVRVDGRPTRVTSSPCWESTGGKCRAIGSV